MNILLELRLRFHRALQGIVDQPSEFLDSIRPSQDSQFGDYQANCAMALGKRLGKPPRQVAAQILERLDVAELCEPPEIAGPGFINLRLKDDWLTQRLTEAIADERLGVPLASPTKTVVVDFSGPNVAKPMHVGHIRSTVIGDAIDRTLRFLGHRVVSDNHLGDWGTQFGMIIYGYKHFRDDEAFRKQPVAELARLYKLVHRVVSHVENLDALPKLAHDLAQRRAHLEQQRKLPPAADKGQAKSAEKALRKMEAGVVDAERELRELKEKVDSFSQDPELSRVWTSHPNIAAAVLEETAKLHAGDQENVQLWSTFLPNCRDEIQRIYRRLDIHFDQELGESFYHDRLAAVVTSFTDRGLARSSEGAMCVFLDGFETPMIIQKKDGAFLYATTDLATIQYRIETWKPDSILYVVDHRQSEHFEKLFAAAKRWGIDRVDLRHISFGTVLGSDGRPYKTRSGDTVGLEGLLDEAVARAYKIVCEGDDKRKEGPVLSDDERRHVAEVVGIAALKYADLSQNRTSDYEFNYDKMLAMTGNTATYMQYSYARVSGIFLKGNVDIDQLRARAAEIRLGFPEERAVALSILRFSEALEDMVFDYRPNLLTAYLFELAKTYFTFYERCSVLDADTPASRLSRLLLSDLTARTIRQGLKLLGIQVVDRM